MVIIMRFINSLASTSLTRTSSLSARSFTVMPSASVMVRVTGGGAAGADGTRAPTGARGASCTGRWPGRLLAERRTLRRTAAAAPGMPGRAGSRLLRAHRLRGQRTRSAEHARRRRSRRRRDTRARTPGTPGRGAPGARTGTGAGSAAGAGGGVAAGCCTIRGWRDLRPLRGRERTRRRRHPAGLLDAKAQRRRHEPSGATHRRAGRRGPRRAGPLRGSTPAAAGGGAVRRRRRRARASTQRRLRRRRAPASLPRHRCGGGLLGFGGAAAGRRGCSGLTVLTRRGGPSTGAVGLGRLGLLRRRAPSCRPWPAPASRRTCRRRAARCCAAARAAR